MKSNGRSGKIRENLSGQLAFSSFVPADLQDIRIQYTDEMVRLLGKAYLLLGRYTEKKPGIIVPFLRLKKMADMKN